MLHSINRLGIFTKTLLVAVFVSATLLLTAMPAEAATLDDVASAIQKLQAVIDSYKLTKQGTVLAATITTVSSAAELTAALNSATGGETILLNAGSYGAFTIAGKSYASLVTVTAASASNPPTFASFTVTNVKNLKLDKIYVAFVPTAATADHHSGMLVSNVENFILSNSLIKVSLNPSGEQVSRGISITGGKNVTIAGNEVTGSRRGILTGGIDGLAIKHNYVHDIRTSQLSGGIVSNVVIEGNHLRTSRAVNFGGDGDHGDFIHYWTQSHQTGPSSNFKIINNFMEQAGGTALLGIYLDNNTNPQGFTNVLIENNILHNSNGQGMRLEDVVGMVVKNNSLIQNEGDFRKAPRIRLEDGTKNVVLENNIVANTTAGGAMDNPTGNNLVERGTIIAQIDDSTKSNYAGKIFAKAPILDGEIEDHAVKAGSIGVGYGATLSRSQILQSQVITSPSAGGGTVTPTPTPTTPSLTLTSSASSVTSGGSATLTWSSANVTACTGSGAWTGSKTTSGTQTTGALSTAGTQTYTLVCTGTSGTVSKSVSVAVTSGTTPAPTPTTGFAIGKKVVTTGSINVRTAAGITSPLISSIPAGVEGTILAGPIVIAGYTWWQTDFSGSYADGWSSDRELKVVVSTTATPAPTLTLSASPTSITSGGSSMLTWSTANATACTASGAWSGAKGTNGTLSTGALSSTQTYTLACTGTGGSVTKSVTVGVMSAPLPPAPVAIRITTTENVNVRGTANGAVLGTQYKGSVGLQSPEAAITAGGYSWVKVDFNSGVDGYVATTYITTGTVSGTTDMQAQINSLLAQLAALQALLAELLKTQG